MDSQQTDLLSKLLVGAFGALGLGAGGVALRERMSKGSAARASDRAESGLVPLLLQERDRSQAGEREAVAALNKLVRERQAEREADAEKIARLTSTNAYLTDEIARLNTEMMSLKRRIARMYPETRPFLATDLAPLLEAPLLDDLPAPRKP